MRVLLVFPDLASGFTNYTGVTSYGIASLAAMLKAEGHPVSLYHMIAEPTEGQFRAAVEAAQPELVGFSVNSHYARRLRMWSAWAKDASRAPIVVGGVHASLAPAAVAALPAVDFVCRGEGEAALRELCDALGAGRDPSRIRNLWARRGERIVENPVRPPCSDLDALPDPDLSVFDFARLSPVRRGVFQYLMSRGCAFHCTYCSIEALRNLAPDTRQYWRFLSPRRAAVQLRDMLERYHPTATLIQFLDTILFPSRKWLREFADHYRELVGRPFVCNLRAEFVTPEVAAILRDMGCQTAKLGVESGDAEILELVLQRNMTLDDMRRAFAILRDHGIARWSYNLVGVPGETLGKALKTIRLNAELEPDLAIPFIFYPYPGTRLHELCAAMGYLTEREYDHYRVGVVARLPTFQERDILFVHRFFTPLMRCYAAGRRLPLPLKRAWVASLDTILSSPLLPRGTIVGLREIHKRLRHRIGEHLVQRSPRLYRLLGGGDPT